MFEKINNMFNLNENLLNLYSKRQEILASNIANADTPNYHAMDINFKDVFKKIFKKNNANLNKIDLARTSLKHLKLKPKKNNSSLFSISPVKISTIKMDGNTVDMNRERIEFIKNNLKYEENIILIKHTIGNLMHVLKG